MTDFAIGDEVVYIGDGESASVYFHGNPGNFSKGRVVAERTKTIYEYEVEWEDDDPTDIYPAKDLAPAIA